jgi:hypothetical protein
VSGLQQVARHRRAHDAQTDESELERSCGHGLPLVV